MRQVGESESASAALARSCEAMTKAFQAWGVSMAQMSDAMVTLGRKWTAMLVLPLMLNWCGAIA